MMMESAQDGDEEIMVGGEGTVSHGDVLIVICENRTKNANEMIV